MKTFRPTFLIILMATIVGMSACKSKKKAQKADIQTQNGSTELVLPLSGKAYQSDKNHFRAKQVGKSPDLAAAKKIALQNAKSELAGNIQSTVKKVTDQYTNQRTIGNQQNFQNKFEELTREVTNQVLLDITIIGEKVFQEPDGAYSYWVAIEANKETILNGIDSGISKNAKLQQDYEKQKFKEIFDEEMKKLEEERP